MQGRDAPDDPLPAAPHQDQRFLVRSAWFLLGVRSVCACTAPTGRDPRATSRVRSRGSIHELEHRLDDAMGSDTERRGLIWMPVLTYGLIPAPQESVAPGQASICSRSYAAAILPRYGTHAGMLSLGQAGASCFVPSVTPARWCWLRAFLPAARHDHSCSRASVPERICKAASTPPTKDVDADVDAWNPSWQRQR